MGNPAWWDPSPLLQSLNVLWLANGVTHPPGALAPYTVCHKDVFTEYLVTSGLYLRSHGWLTRDLDIPSVSHSAGECSPSEIQCPGCSDNRQPLPGFVSGSWINSWDSLELEARGILFRSISSLPRLTSG